MNNTPLHYAAASGNESILIYLLEKHARILTSSSGNSPLHVVRYNNNNNCLLKKNKFRQLKMANKVHVVY